MRVARHHVGGGGPVVLVARTVLLDIRVQPLDTLGRLEADGHAIIGEGKAHLGQVGLAAEIAVLDPHPVEHGE